MLSAGLLEPFERAIVLAGLSETLGERERQEALRARLDQLLLDAPRS